MIAEDQIYYTANDIEFQFGHSNPIPVVDDITNIDTFQTEINNVELAEYTEPEPIYENTPKENYYQTPFYSKSDLKLFQFHTNMYMNFYFLNHMIRLHFQNVFSNHAFSFSLGAKNWSAWFKDAPLRDQNHL